MCRAVESDSTAPGSLELMEREGHAYEDESKSKKLIFELAPGFVSQIVHLLIVPIGACTLQSTKFLREMKRWDREAKTDQLANKSEHKPQSGPRFQMEYGYLLLRLHSKLL